MEYRQTLRNLEKLVTWEGIIGRKKRKVFNQFLEHEDPRIRRYAAELDAEDRHIRAHWRDEESYCEAGDLLYGEELEAFDIDFLEYLQAESPGIGASGCAGDDNVFSQEPAESK